MLSELYSISVPASRRVVTEFLFKEIAVNQTQGASSLRMVWSIGDLPHTAHLRPSYGIPQEEQCISSIGTGVSYSPIS